MFDSYKSSDMKLHFLQEEAILAIVVQVIGMFLILSSVVMFIKHISLHKLENVLQINLLLSSAVFLIIDWTLTLPGNLGCEVFSVVFIMFGTACTYTTVGIALSRFQVMMQITVTISVKISAALSIITIWVISFICVLYSVMMKTMFVFQREKEMDKIIPSENEYSNASKQTMCFFNDGVLYGSPIPSLCFIVVGILFPIFIMLFVYIKIFRKVRRARISRWINHVAMERSRQTAVIQLRGRKANVFQLSSNSLNGGNFQSSMSNQANYRRERSVLTKGMFAVLIVMLCWIPFATTWLYLALGFDAEYVFYFRYLMIIAKVSVILNVSHYVCFNTKYRSLYLQTAFAPFTNILRILQTDAADCTPSHLDSQTASYISSNVLDRPLCTQRNNTALTPIHENLTDKVQAFKDTPQKEIQRTSQQHQQHRLHRSISMPEKIRRISKIVHPEPLGNIQN